ncbi:DUF2520 domain-containing protein [Leucobacter allii]|uniref:DUF2520 domain-containing protein n=1 Tax=Leucobacter allii TaxID=2932247 RepID=A0ABY4FK75_9MICO|nr:DUF2520 domain-containing protein [Leucobacter allii]UOQ56612.1 DUF2520 domain-containing protein [Leucobacter allii]
MRIRIVGRGRMGAALAAALVAAGADVAAPAGRGWDWPSEGAPPDAILLAVPDAAIADAAARLTPGPFVGHCSGITTLAPLAPHAAFSLHPLLSVTEGGGVTGGHSVTEGVGAGVFAGAHAAVDGASPEALAVAERLAALLGLTTFRVEDRDRAAYHAAASVSANFLVVLEDLAERLAASAGVPRAALLPLAGAALRNWAGAGGSRALTGPIARGDEGTVARQLTAVRERLPEDASLVDALVAATRRLAARRDPGPNDPERADPAAGTTGSRPPEEQP